MRDRGSGSAFQVFLTILGAVALVAGGTTVVLGVDSIMGAEPVSATVDSEMRFYAVWYAGVGLLILRSARRLEREAWVIRGVAGTLFVAGCSRALSWLVVGEPHLMAQILMVIELVLPLVIVPWLKWVERAARSSAAS